METFLPGEKGFKDGAEEADGWKREHQRVFRPGNVKGPIPRALVNKSRKQFAFLSFVELDFFKDLQQCYADCGWEQTDAVMFQPIRPESPSVLAQLETRGYTQVYRIALLAVSPLRARFADPPPTKPQRLAAARWTLLGQRIYRPRVKMAFSNISREGLDDDRDITGEPTHFLPHVRLRADCLLINLTKWSYVILAQAHNDFAEELAFIARTNGWEVTDSVMLSVDHTEGSMLQTHLQRKGARVGTAVECEFTFPRF